MKGSLTRLPMLPDSRIGKLLPQHPTALSCKK